MSLIFTHDPSIREWGWCISDADGNVQDVGCIKTKSRASKDGVRKGIDRTRRMSVITDQFENLFNSFNIEVLASEQPGGSQNASAAMTLGMVQGLIHATAEWKDLPIDYYSPYQVKKNATGSGHGEKSDVRKFAQENYDLPEIEYKYQKEAIADAVAVLDLALKRSDYVKML